MPAQRCAPAYRAPYSTNALIRQSVFSAGVCRPSGKSPTMIFILESPGYFVADTKLGLGIRGRVCSR